MVRILGYSTSVGSDTEEPREIIKNPSTSGDNGWLIRFFDSAFFCEWIAVSYLYKHEHSGVRDYLCNRMYTLPLPGIESYLFQLCYMLLHKPSPSLDKYVVDMCSKSLRIAIKVHWFLLAESEDVEDCEEILRLQERCQMAALTGDWPPLIRPRKSTGTSPLGKSRMFKLLSSRRILPLSSSPLQQRPPPSIPSPIAADEGHVEPSKGPTEELELSMKVLKKLMPGPKVRDAFLKRFREKEDDESEQSKSTEQEGFFRRLFREKDDEERAVRSDELMNSESFFRRMFRDRSESDERTGVRLVDDEEKEGFFRRLFRDKSDDQEKTEEDEKGTASWDEEFFFFRKFFKVHPEEEKSSLSARENSATVTPESSPGTEGFFKRMFRDRPPEEGRLPSSRREDRSSPSSFLKRLFKDRIEENGGNLVEDGSSPNSQSLDGINMSGNSSMQNGFHHADGFLKERIASENTESFCSGERDSEAVVPSRKSFDGSEELNSTEVIFKDIPNTAEKSSPGFGIRSLADWSLPSFGKPSRPGSPKQSTDRTSSKPPLPKYPYFHIRKGTYHATLDFVQSLCDISSGLIDVFPMEDRRKALHESLMELNSLLAITETDGGVCFPMGKGIFQVVHIPEDDAALMNSREKAPFLVCIEVLKCDEDGFIKEQREAIASKLTRAGVPVANRDVKLQRPPPWAYPMWNQTDVHKPESEHFLRTASRAIDRAMAHQWETRIKIVDVTLAIGQKLSDAKKTAQVHTMMSNAENESSSNQDSGIVQLQDKMVSSDAPDNVDDRFLQAPHSIAFGEDACHSDSTFSPGEDRYKAGAREVENGVELRVCGEEWVSVTLTAIPGMNIEDVGEDFPLRRDHRRVPSTIAMAEVKAAAAKGQAPAGLPVKRSGMGPSAAEVMESIGADAKATDALAGELWEHKKERIKQASKFGSSIGWDLRSVIVKSGDDCRQEHLAVQLVFQFYDIFQEAGLPLWLRPYEVIVTSSHTALIETIPDTASIHAIKSRNSDLSSLRDFFCNKYEKDSPALKLAQRNFVESMAGYSILCYLLQVKDRHNGNLLIDEEGHIIHIDFGFMLSNSPGGVNFESAPFKLTRELLEVMDSDAEGSSSEFFDYFKVLCIQGFLACRKHAERIILLVEMMQDSGCPCFRGGSRTIQNLRKRFHLSLTEEQCVSLVLSLISSSLDAWRTRQYDYYQRVLNGIL
ncbi:hypothetical protein O6H91_09G024200 [Diphasiastrum complanatum]|uniref:Uncharacterized protein n=1 Tax=Diphasiastrum complanatum TaxID=34168 RepID=A0ACC2CM43_DIPCM|nr:hypothetical protein O6H91_09G024200 [Diphasiastrum complanatum]